MTFQDVIPWIESIFLGKSKPGLDANLFVLAAWLSVPGLWRLTHVYATRGKDAAAICCGLAAAGVVALMLFKAEAPSKTVKPPPAPPVVSVPKPPVPVQGNVGGGGTPAPQTSAPQFERFADTALSGRPFATARARPSRPAAGKRAASAWFTTAAFAR
jgi:hypothetical protein